MRLPRDMRLPLVGDVRTRMTEVLRDIVDQVNRVSEGAIAGFHNAQTAAPTQGNYAKGDFIPNKEPAELGAAGSKYIVHGWRCVASGSPGTWVECRFLTGN